MPGTGSNVTRRANVARSRTAGGDGGRDDAQGLRSLPLAETISRLESSPQGLSGAEAAARVARFGPNEIAAERSSQWARFLGYFWGPIAWMIEVAVILSGVLRHWPDFVIVLILLFANAGVGFWEEHQAGKAIEALKSELAVRTRVLRDGVWISPPVRDLVPGDVIGLRLGDIVPADARLLDGDALEMDQSALTGESLPATRETGDAVYSASVVRHGEATAIVYATGSSTFFGRTAELVRRGEGVSHFQRAVLRIGTYLIFLAAAMVGTIVVVSSLRGDPFLTTAQLALVLTVAAIPVAMPTVLSVTMAVGARRLAQRKAIVSRLVAIEELAGVDVLCTDKTGTLTLNQLTLGSAFVAEGLEEQDVIVVASLASRRDDSDPIDTAVLDGLDDAAALDRFVVTHFSPFDPVAKRTEATVTRGDGAIERVTKGAPQVVLALVEGPEDTVAAARDAVDRFAERGFRSLGVARAAGDGPWQLVGVLPLYDPPRPDAAATISTARQMGVSVKMLTGDSLAIAKETATALDMGARILDAASLGDSGRDESTETMTSIEGADGYAQVFPEHKYHIVDVLQGRGHIVGMTGDGVNDAPALKKADCGIAVSGATDAARAAADIVLTTPGLSVIIEAIKESRQIFQRMNNYAIYRIAETLRVLLFVTLVILTYNFFPVTAIQIVMLALLNDGAILSIAYDNVHYRPVPEAWNMRVVLGAATVLGVVGPLAAFGAYLLGRRVFHLDPAALQTMMYLLLSVAGHLTVFQARTRGPFWSIRPARVLLLAVIGTQVLATLIAATGVFMTALAWRYVAFVWGYALIWFLVTDRVKLLAYRFIDR